MRGVEVEVEGLQMHKILVMVEVEVEGLKQERTREQIRITEGTADLETVEELEEQGVQHSTIVHLRLSVVSEPLLVVLEAVWEYLEPSGKGETEE